MNNKTETATLNKIWSLQIDTILPILAFSIPFLLSGPQLITGTIVNTFLFIASAKQINQRHLYLIALLPSLGAVSHGILFGQFTSYLLFFIPSIWLGNMVLILSFNKLKTALAFPFSIILPSIFKTTVLYLSALVFTGIHLVPTIFISSMGAVQIFTSMMGGTAAYVFYKIGKRKI